MLRRGHRCSLLLGRHGRPTRVGRERGAAGGRGSGTSVRARAGTRSAGGRPSSSSRAPSASSSRPRRSGPSTAPRRASRRCTSTSRCPVSARPAGVSSRARGRRSSPRWALSRSPRPSRSSTQRLTVIGSAPRTRASDRSEQPGRPATPRSTAAWGGVRPRSASCWAHPARRVRARRLSRNPSPDSIGGGARCPAPGDGAAPVVGWRGRRSTCTRHSPLGSPRSSAGSSERCTPVGGCPGEAHPSLYRVIQSARPATSSRDGTGLAPGVRRGGGRRSLAMPRSAWGSA